MKALRCPSCSEKLEKNLKDGESVWRCMHCIEAWFIVKIGKPKGGKR